MKLSRNFELAEFESASHRALTADEIEAARWWAVNVLQPARDVLGPIRVTSFVRLGSATHGSGWAVDVSPVWVSVRALADWLAAHYVAAVGGDGRIRQVIDETGAPGGPHVHLARYLAPGAVAGYLEGPNDEGRYPATAPDPARIRARDYQLVILAGAAVALAVVWLG